MLAHRLPQPPMQCNALDIGSKDVAPNLPGWSVQRTDFLSNYVKNPAFTTSDQNRFCDAPSVTFDTTRKLEHEGNM